MMALQRIDELALARSGPFKGGAVDGYVSAMNLFLVVLAHAAYHGWTAAYNSRRNADGHLAAAFIN